MTSSRRRRSRRSRSRPDGCSSSASGPARRPAGCSIAIRTRRSPGSTLSRRWSFKARELGIEVRLARMEDPLPDGPWDLVISVLSVHHLDDDGKRDLFRRVREQSRAMVIGDVVAADTQLTPLEEGGRRLPVARRGHVEWCSGELVWEADDLAVIRAVYD